MPILTRADLESIRGPRRLAKLLNEAADPADDADTQELHRQTRLQEALQAGDNLLSQFLDIHHQPEPFPEVLRQMARDEAMYYLEQHTETGATEAADAAATQRRRDLKDMRAREQWPSRAEGQSNQSVSYVANTSAFSRSRLKGFV